MLYIVLGFIWGGAGAWFMSRYAFTLGLVDLPNSRSSHSSPTPRGGGVGLLLAFVVTAYVAGAPMSLWLPATLLALVSFFDDRLELSPRVRLLFQFTSATAVVFGVVFTEFSLFTLILVPFWLLFIVGTANFYNFMDGINGIAGIAGVVCFGLTALFARLVEADSALILLSAAMAAACAGFLPFNVPKARVFMGDVGSVLLGFAFAGLAFILTNDLAGFLCLVAFICPFYADALTTLFFRWSDGEKLSQAHRRHLYQILANELKNPHWRISLGYGSVQLLFGLLMVWVWRQGLIWQIALLGLFFFAFFMLTVHVRRIAKLVSSV